MASNSTVCLEIWTADSDSVFLWLVMTAESGISKRAGAVVTVRLPAVCVCSSCRIRTEYKFGNYSARRRWGEKSEKRKTKKAEAEAENVNSSCIHIHKRTPARSAVLCYSWVKVVGNSGLVRQKHTQQPCPCQWLCVCVMLGSLCQCALSHSPALSHLSLGEKLESYRLLQAC